jgi:hypothetical protein
MSTLAETAIVDYRLSYANQGKQYIHFPFLFAANKQKFAVSVFRLQKITRVAVSLRSVFRLQNSGRARFGFADFSAGKFADLFILVPGFVTSLCCCD